MRFAVATLALLALGFTPFTVTAAPQDTPSFTIDLATLAYTGPPGVLTLAESQPGERYVWNVTLAENYTVGAFRLGHVFDIERAQQVVPTFDTQSYEYPLFEFFPGDDVRNVDSIARVYHFENTSDGPVLHLGLPGAVWYNRSGPLVGRLTLQRDVTPPRFESLGTPQNLTSIGFYRETRTNEFAIVDLQVRPHGAQEWIRNPTTLFHVLQKFPVQGLDAERDYDVRLVATDWAGNQNVTPIEALRTPAAAVRPIPVITLVSPTPNATLPRGANLTLVARIDMNSLATNSSSTGSAAIRLFVDKREVTDGVRFENGTLTYAMRSLSDGHHSYSVEATNPEGGSAYARGAFDVGSGNHAAPGLAWPTALVVLALAALGARQTRTR